MRVWFDADNGPHVLILAPLARELTRRGHEVSFTARDRTSTCELLELYGLPFRKVGREYGKGMASKAAGTVGRALALARAAFAWRADVSFGHGSRALPLASRLLGVPSLTMYDYEWVDPRLFNWTCRRILLPEAIDAARCREAGIDVGKVVGYPGYKEHLYLGSRPLDASVATDLGLREGMVHMLLRPPATRAHYHNPEAEVILQEILRLVAASPQVQLVYLARGSEQAAWAGAIPPERLLVPRRVYDGPSLIAAMDLVVSGGGTMTREAAILGVPSYSFFRGRGGRVDESLEAQGRLTTIGAAAEVKPKLQLRRRESAPVPPDGSPLVGFICERVLDAGGSGRAGRTT